MTRRLAFGCLLAMVALSGCQTETDGRPVGAPATVTETEPTFPTPRPSVSRPPATPRPAPPSSPAAAPPTGAPAVALPPSSSGYVYIETKSGKTRCQMNSAEVECEAQFTKSPVVDGTPANGVGVTSAGAIRWVSGNLGDIPVVTLDYQTYTAVGWTIVADIAGTRFTNDATGHGMLVNIDGASPV